VGVGLLSCCFFSWKPSYNWCNGDKFRGGILFFFIFVVVSWIAVFTWTKAEFIADFNWYATFSPWWAIGLVCLGILGVFWIIFIGNRNSVDFPIYAAMIATATVAYITICAFLILLAHNLEAYYHDLPTYPWTLVATPLVIFECYSVCACCVLQVMIYK